MLVAFVAGAIASILYDVAFPYFFPEAARRLRERARQAAAAREQKRQQAAWDEEQKKRQAVMEQAQRMQQEADRVAREAAARRYKAECDAARDALSQFYGEHMEVLGDAFPMAMIVAFMRSEMGETKTPAELWKICLNKITELLPLIAKGKEGRARLVKIGQKIDADIKECRLKIARAKKTAAQLKDAGQDADFLEDELFGHRANLKRCEAQKTYLLRLMKEGTT